MSLITYILESCDGNLKYRVNFTGATYLDVGETWNVECDGIPNGCYNVLENTSETLDEYNGDECLFVEFESCEDCESSVDSLSSVPSEPCYQWFPCDGGSPIYVPTAYDNYDYFQYGSNCYYNSYNIVNTAPSPTSIGATQWRLSCEICNSYLTSTQVQCYEYIPCPNNVRPFTIENAVPSLGQTNIFYPETSSWAGSDTIYFQNTETGENRCFYRNGLGTKERYPTINVTAITGNTSTSSDPIDGCDLCGTVCDSQDIVIFIDNYCCQSGNPADYNDLESFFNASVAGAKKYVESLEDDINSGIIQVAIYRKPSGSCSTSGLVLDLTDNYTNIINALDNLTFQSGALDRAENFFDIYDVLTTGYFREGATATLLWLADSFYSHVNGECWPPSPFNSWWNPKEHYASIMKMGWMNGPFGKQIRVQIVEFDSELYPWPATESSASSPDDYMLTTHADWSATTWANINPLCEDFVPPGDDFDIYQARPCCDGPELYVSLETGTTVSLGNDGFNYQGFCYYLNSVVSDSYSAYTSVNLLSGDVVTNICSSTSNPDCSCGKIEVRKFIGCCDPTDNITVAFDTSVAGSIASGDGIIYSGDCYVWDGGPTQTVTYSDAITTDFITDICTLYCIDDFCPSNTPTPTPSLSITPTISLTPTPTATPPIGLSSIWSGCTTGALYRLYDLSSGQNIEGVIGGVSGFTTSGPTYGATLNDDCLTPVAGFDTSDIVYSEFSTTAYTNCEICQDAFNYTSYRVVYSGCCYGEQGMDVYSFNNNLTLTPGYVFYDGVECKTIISTTVVPDSSLTQIDTLYETCSGCTDINVCTVSGCGQQDIVILMDQSGSIDNNEWDIFVDGVVAIATGLEGNMNSGDVKVGALKWSYCDNVDLVSDLTTNYANFVSAVSSANNDGGGTYVGQALIDAYNMLVGGSSTPGAEKNIVILTDGGISDFNYNCTTTSYSASQLATQMKTGNYGSGQIIKITTVGIGNNAQSSQLSSLSSGPDFQYMTSDFEDFAENISSQISITSCDETEDPGSEFDYYTASACCETYGLQNIIVQTSTATTVTLGTDGFSWGGNCYTFENSVDAETYSGQSVHFVSESLLLSNVCSDTVNCRSCGTYQKTYLRNCCIDYDKIQILYSGTPNNGEGIEYNGFCYVYTGDTTGTDVGLTYNTLVEDLCISGDCDCRSISPTPTPTVTVTSTPTVTATSTITPTPTPTITITPSITNTVTPSPTFGLSNTPTPTLTPTISITPTLTPTITVSPTPSPTRGTILWLAENCCDGTDTLNVTLPTQTTKIFVFYDGTSLDFTKAEQASENIRAWYQDKVDGGDVSDGNLYEGVIGAHSNNGENWLWWASYPYLGSLSGGTLTDSTVISEFNTAVDDSIYNSSFCKSSVGGCVPNDTKFNDGYPYDSTSDIYQRINRGYQLTGGYGTDDPRSNGVPFDHSLLTTNTDSGNGKFDGGITDYIVILIADESDGAVGFYHGKGTKETLTTQGFNLYNTSVTAPQYYLSTAGSQPTNRFTHDYESYLQVWNDIQTSGGRINSIIYPVIDDSISRIPFPLHCVGAIEGETINNTEFQTKYGEPITSVGPENLDLSLISTQNPYSNLSSNSIYTGLPLSYQNGPGLKNFGVQVDPTVTDFSLGSITDALDGFLDSLDVTNGYGFGYNGECYYFVSQTTGISDVDLKWSQVEEDYCNTSSCICSSNTPTVTPTFTVTPTPSPTNLPECVSGTTDGSYRFTDCCGIEQIGTSLGQVVCVDTTFTYEGVNLTYIECDNSCDQGPLEISVSLTGACEGQGVISLNVQKGTPPYYVENTTTGEIQSGYGPEFIFDGLSEGLYDIYIYDSGTPNRTFETTYQIQPCFDAIISSYSNATCGQSNGIITISGNSTTTLDYDVSIYVVGTSTPFFEGTMGSNVQQFSTDINPGYTYYAIVTNSDNVSAQTQNVTITTTPEVEFGISYTGTSQCGGCNGAAEVTGLTGTPPYTYVWGNGQTTYIATGLCEGSTTVVVTDFNGCSSSGSVTIEKIPPLGISSYEGVQPSCFDCDGTITIQVTGGTTPYTFLGSNTQTDTNSDGEFTLSGLCGGRYGISVTDYNGCVLQQEYTLNSSSGINSVTVTKNDSTCGGNGSLKIDVVAIVGSITYSITGNTNNYTESKTTNNQTNTFTNLEADTYTIEVKTTSQCSFITTETINDDEAFTVSVVPSNASCGSPNGSATINVFSGTSEIAYPIDYLVTRVSDNTVVYSSVDSTVDSEGVSNLSAGSYEVNIEDNTGCVATTFFSITQEGDGVQAILYSTECVLGNDGTASIDVTQGQPPFYVTWSDNVPESQRNEFEISGLSGGTYSAQIIDGNGCQVIKFTTINCSSENVDNYVINTICQQDFITNSQGKRGFYEMLNEAFLDLNEPGKDCELVSAAFTGVLVISGGSYGYNAGYANTFYTTNDLNDVPSDNLWESVVQGLLSNYTGITYTTDILNNVFTIKGDCEGDEDPTNGAYVNLSIEIDLDVDCDSTGVPPSPTPTSTVTPTITLTPSVTPTISVTPSVTSTVTPTISISPTPGASVTTTPTVTPTLTITPTNTVTPTITITPSPTPSATLAQEKALLFILEQSNNLAFATYMNNNGSSFYGFGYGSTPSSGTDVTLFMDWPGWFDGTAPTVIEQTVPQSNGGTDTYGNSIEQYKFLTTEVPQGTATDAWYIWLVPQSLIGSSSNRQLTIGYNINSNPNSLTYQSMTSSIYTHEGVYTGSNWENGSYRMYTTHPGSAFSISNNNTDDLYFRGGSVG